MSSKEVFETAAGTVKELAEEVLKGERYAHAQTSTWCAAIGDEAAQRLATALPQHKIVVNVVVMEKTEGGFKTYNAAVWDTENDDSHSIRIEVNNIRCIVTLWCLKK